jgi:hypothetical protein
MRNYGEHPHLGGSCISFQYQGSALLLIASLGIATSSGFVLASDEIKVAPNWPPDAVAREARSNLLNRRDDLEALAQKIITSPYVMVSQQEPGKVEARRADSEWDDVESPGDSGDWSELLTAAGFKFALRHKNDIHFTNIVDDTVIVDGVAHSYMYIWSDEYLSLECHPEQGDFDCGQCGKRLGNSWTILFAWVPSDMADWPEEDSDQCIGDFVSAMGDRSSSPNED